MFHSVEGVLHMDGRCLFERVPPCRPSDVDARRAMSRLYAHAHDAEVVPDDDRVQGEEGLRRIAVAPVFGSLRRALAVLVGHGARVFLLRVAQLSRRTGDSHHHVVVQGTWSDLDLVEEKDDDAHRMKAYESAVRRGEAPPGGCYEFVVDTSSRIDPRIAPGGTSVWLARGDRVTIRMHFASQHGIGVYRAGLFVSEDASEEWSLRFDVYADHRYDVEDVDDVDAEAVTRHLLCVQLARDAHVVRRILQGVWKHHLEKIRGAWSADAQLRVLTCDDGDVPDELLRLVDVARVLRDAGTPCDEADDLYWRARLRIEAGVEDEERLMRVPVTMARLCAVVLAGGIMDEKEEHRMLRSVLPSDATMPTWGAFLARRLPPGLSPPPPSPVSLIGISSLDEELPPDAAASLVPGEPLYAYVVDVCDGLWLTRDEDAPVVRATHVRRVDEANVVVRLDEAAQRRNSLQTWFPTLASRLQDAAWARDGEIAACWKEAAYRRPTTTTWTLRDGVDGTGNASSLGLAVAVLLGLVFWSGVVQDVRVFLSAATRFAVVGIRKDDDTYVLVDCTRTQRNAFDAILSAGPPPPPPLTYKVRRGCVLEMRRQNMWCVVVVLSVQSKDGGTAVRVRCAETGDEFPLCLASQTWRRLARGNACNVERVVVAYDRGEKRSRPADRED